MNHINLMGTNFLWLYIWTISAEASSQGVECPKVFSRTNSFGYTWPMTSYIYCSTGCCGGRDNRYCCEKPRHHNVGLYLGIVSAAVVLIVLIVSLTCCCIQKYNKKSVIIGVDPGVQVPGGGSRELIELSIPNDSYLDQQDIVFGNRASGSPPLHQQAIVASGPSSLYQQARASGLFPPYQHAITSGNRVSGPLSRYKHASNRASVPMVIHSSTSGKLFDTIG